MNHEASMPGLWQLVSYVVRWPDGRETAPLGADAVGWLYYGADGFVAGTMMERGRPRFATGNRLGADAAEKLRAWDSAISYMGSWEEQGDRVLHRIHASIFPDWTGDEQPRLRRVLPNGDVELVAAIEERGVRRDAIATWRRCRVQDMRAA